MPLVFVDVAQSLGLPPLGSECLAFEDFDGDGKPDILMVAQSQTGDEALDVYLNTGTGSFKQITSAFKIPNGQVVHCAVGDIDNDGRPDVAVSMFFQSTVFLLHNVGGGALQQTATAALPQAPKMGGGSALGFADFNNDGWLDLVVGVYELPPNTGEATCAPTSEGFSCTIASPRCGPPPVVFPNDRSGKLSAYVSMVDPTTCSPANVDAIAITDYNGDGRPDVFIANDWGVNAFYVQGPTPFQFTDIAPTLALKGYNAAMGAAFADFDLDGNLDLYVPDLGSSQLYLGQGGGALAWRGPDWGVAVATTYTSEWAALADDFDSDGFTDVWGANAAEVHGYADLATVGEGVTQLAPVPMSDFVFHNQGGHGFNLLLVPQTLQASPSAITGATATADYDGDGRLDIVELIGSPIRVQLMHNEGPRSHWLDVRLTGHKSNRDGLGAVVIIKQSGRPDVSKMMMRTRGSVGESWPVVHFGLGSRTDIASVDIAWPGGTKQSVTAPGADQVLGVDEAQ